MGILDFVWLIIVGLVIGAIARLIHPGKENMGCIMTILIGIVGSVVAGVIVKYADWSSWVSFIIAIALAVILIEIYARIKGRRIVT